MQNEHRIQTNLLEGHVGSASTNPAVGEGDVTLGINDGGYADAYGGDGEIHAFVADDEVVDATAVEVILTEEEEELLAKQKQRRLIACVFCVVVLVAAIVVPVTVTSGDSGTTSRAPSVSPTEQPSASPSSAPTDGDFPPVAACLSDEVALTNEESFQNRSSAQWKALLWIVKDDEFVRKEGLECPDKRYVDRYALATMFFEMNGENWLDCGLQNPDCTFNRNQFGWLSDNDVCDWHRIECMETDVVGLNFGSQFPSERALTRFIGTFPSEMRQLTDLVQINLKEAQTAGSIPEFFMALSNLQELNLENNNMTGSLPSFLSGEAFPSLKILLLTNNALTGSIPVSHGTLSSLLQYRVASNKLTGKIPPELANIAGIAHIDLAENELTGYVPTALFQLTELRILSLHDNEKIQGIIPTDIGILSSLERLQLQFTKFGSTIPPELYTIPNLREINLRGANFTGEIHPSIENATYLQILDIGINNIGGPLPEIHNVQFLEELWLDFTQVTGELSPDICSHIGNDFGQLSVLLLDCTKIALPANCSDCQFCSRGRGCRSSGTST